MRSYAVLRALDRAWVLCPSILRIALPGRQLLRELREAFADLRREHTTRCLVLKSAVPGTFCAGADLKVSFWLCGPAAQNLLDKCIIR